MLLLEMLLEMSMHDAKELIASYIPDFPMNAATPEVVSQARRKLAKRFHPDRGGSEEEMKRVNDALDTLENNHGSVDWNDPFWANRGWTRDPNRPKRPPQREPEKKYPYPKGYGGKPGEMSNTPPWGWAGAQWRRPDVHDDGVGMSPRDIRKIMRKAWEMSDRPDPDPRNEYNFQNFDGTFMRGSFTAYANQKTLAEIASWMLMWDNFFDSKAILVKRAPRLNKENVRVIAMPVENGKISRRSKWFSINMNKVYDEDMSRDWNERKNVGKLRKRLGID